MSVKLSIIEENLETSPEVNSCQTKKELLSKLENISKIRLCLRLKSLCKDFDCIRKSIQCNKEKN